MWQPFITIWVIIIAYLCHVPFAVRTKRWLDKHPEVWDDQPKQRRAVRRANRRAQPQPPFDDAAGAAQAERAPAMIPGGGAQQLTLTARLNTSAVDSRRGVVRIHPNAVAALGIREWDAVSLTGSRTTAAVAGLADPDTPVGIVLLDDVTLSNAGLREGTAVIVSAGHRLRRAVGDAVRLHRWPPSRSTPVTLRQALLGKVMTVGDAVSLLPRDLGPGTSTSAATRALAAAVGISWTSELLTVTGVDPDGPVSVQPNSSGHLGKRSPGRLRAYSRRTP